MAKASSGRNKILSRGRDTIRLATNLYFFHIRSFGLSWISLCLPAIVKKGKALNGKALKRKALNWKAPQLMLIKGYEELILYPRKNNRLVKDEFGRGRYVLVRYQSSYLKEVTSLFSMQEERRSNS